jgi:hypothetical protein
LARRELSTPPEKATPTLGVSEIFSDTASWRACLKAINGV